MKFKIFIMLLAAAGVGFILLDVRNNVTKNPEIDNTDYKWLMTFSKCYTSANAEIKEALENDGKILKDEYREISHKCSVSLDIKNAGAKDRLKEFLK